MLCMLYAFIRNEPCWICACVRPCRPEDTLHIPLLEAAQEKSDGTLLPEENVNEPYEMVLQPTKEAQVGPR